MKKIPFTSKLQSIRSIEKRNQAFKELSRKEQRQEIAFEALKLVLNNKVIASNGCYWGSKLNDLADKVLAFGCSDDSKALQQALLKKLPAQQDCKVCQRGLMMLAQIRLANTVKPDDEEMDKGDERNIKGFNMNRFYEMEDEYEYSLYDQPHYAHSPEKLANICCNIIANGNFKKTDGKDYLKLWGLTKYFEF